MPRPSAHLLALSQQTKWSVLAKLGSAPAMRLTVLVPLIGTMLLFNSEVERFLQWPEFFRRDVTRARDLIPYNNLYFTYFGLCFLGFGSIVFSFLCPREIRDEPNIGRYVRDTPAVSAPTIAKSDFATVLSLRFNGPEMLDDIPYSRVDYPGELQAEFHQLFQLLYSNVDLGDHDDMPNIMNGAGYLEFTPLARDVQKNIRATWAYTMPFYDAAPKFAGDIAFMKYRSLDYTNVSSRMFVAATYAIGFGLLLKPTIHVFILVAFGWMLPAGS